MAEKRECADALNCTYNQINPCIKAVRDLFSNCPFKDWKDTPCQQKKERKKKA